MASSSLTVSANGKEIRKYGGTRGSVKWLHAQYKVMTLTEFLCRHRKSDEDDFKSLTLVLRLNKS